MQSILVAGIDSVVGANLAACLSDRFRVFGLSFSTPISLTGCQTRCFPDHNAETVRNWVATVRPAWLVYCGPAAQSTWDGIERPLCESRCLAAAVNWACAAREFDCRLTLISSDAVFSGPWMFHKEESSCQSNSHEAGIIRAVETATRRCCPNALVARTNAYGWTPQSVGPGWIERTLSALETRTAGPFDCVRHATPILATDLAEILEQAFQERLEGVYHIAGAERVNPARFVEHLAERFGLPAPRSATINSLSQPPTGFGRGETSLQTGKIRKALEVAMPTLADGLQRLYEQHQNGYAEQFDSASPRVHEKVA